MRTSVSFTTNIGMFGEDSDVCMRKVRPEAVARLSSDSANFLVTKMTVAAARIFEEGQCAAEDVPVDVLCVVFVTEKSKRNGARANDAVDIKIRSFEVSDTLPRTLRTVLGRMPSNYVKICHVKICRGKMKHRSSWTTRIAHCEFSTQKLASSQMTQRCG